MSLEPTQPQRKAGACKQCQNAGQSRHHRGTIEVFYSSSAPNMSAVSIRRLPEGRDVWPRR